MLRFTVLLKVLLIKSSWASTSCSRFFKADSVGHSFDTLGLPIQKGCGAPADILDCVREQSLFHTPGTGASQSACQVAFRRVPALPSRAPPSAAFGRRIA